MVDEGFLTYSSHRDGLVASSFVVQPTADRAGKKTNPQTTI
jgi:hypothetical protein